MKFARSEGRGGMTTFLICIEIDGEMWYNIWDKKSFDKRGSERV